MDQAFKAYLGSEEHWFAVRKRIKTKPETNVGNPFKNALLSGRNEFYPMREKC